MTEKDETPEQDPGYGEDAPTLKDAFIGYGGVIGGVVAMALLLVLLMKVLR